MKKTLLVLLLLLALPLAAQDKRAQAYQLMEQNKYVEALPLLEELARENPKDGQVMLRLGFCRLVQANTLPDPAARKQARARAREALEAAQALGVRDSLLSAALASLSPDGGEDAHFSDNPQADAAMQKAEAEFSAGHYPQARAGYEKALELQPDLYEAALYIGQCYRIEGDEAKSAEWYGRAIQIAPDRETAYRYWGNALMRAGQAQEALDKYILGYLCEPYGRLSRNGLAEWASQQGITLAHPDIIIPVEVDGDNVKITPNAGPAWLAYGLQHTSWRNEKWAKAHPGKPYRPSLEEEADSIRTALGAGPLDGSLETLKKLDQAGLLEAYILLGLPSEGIVDDYAAYHKAHPDLLERYVREVVLKGGKVG